MADIIIHINESGYYVLLRYSGVAKRVIETGWRYPEVPTAVALELTRLMYPTLVIELAGVLL